MIAIHYDWLGVHIGQIQAQLFPVVLLAFTPMLAYYEITHKWILPWFTSGFL